MAKMFSGKSILITGGTGSFGSYIVKTILKENPRSVIVFSRDEDKQYSLHHELKEFNNKIRFIIGDVRDENSLKKGMRDGVDIVLHAAALKQIPSTEYNILEAVRTNVLGAQNVVEACIENNVKKAIAISTDKAVEPINVMGITKALQERIFILGNKQRGNAITKFSVVRYGNVIASRGSVIPLFKKQIDAGGPITLTDKRMTRFILTLKEAVQLISRTLTDMVGGEVFIPKVKPFRVNDLAEVMVSELKPKDKRIVEIGIRPGEKLHETLISPIESIRSVRKRDYYIVLPQIELDEIGFTYKIPTYKRKEFRYSSDTGPFMNKLQIRKMLVEENIFR